MTYETTMMACFLGYIVQAIINNFLPLLFVRLQFQYHIPLSRITFLITFNFGLQLLVDILSVPLVKKIGYRGGMILAHGCSILGLVLLVILPDVLSSAFMGLMIPVMTYAVGGGLLEVLVSPIMEACPTDNKEKAMSLLHSFYCWGHVGVVLLSTLFFRFMGIGNWKMLALLWTLIPLYNLYLFTRVPITTLEESKKEQTGKKVFTTKDLLKNGMFWLFFVMMICSGASEQAVSQWASALAEKGLGIAKSLGDLCGPMMFALTMGLSRLIYGKFGEKIRLKYFCAFSVCLCILGYAGIVFIPDPIVNLLSCAVVGFSVGIFWPGTFSLSSEAVPAGGTGMFAFLALAGDIGCMSGPTLAGTMAAAFGENLKIGVLWALIFPVCMGVCLLVLYITSQRHKL